jgi:ABC-type sugar transport system ATPase subunit
MAGAAPSTTDAVIETRGLRKSFGSVLALDDLTLSVPAGESSGSGR